MIWHSNFDWYKALLRPFEKYSKFFQKKCQIVFPGAIKIFPAACKYALIKTNSFFFSLFFLRILWSAYQINQRERKPLRKSDHCQPLKKMPKYHSDDMTCYWSREIIILVILS